MEILNSEIINSHVFKDDPVGMILLTLFAAVLLVLGLTWLIDVIMKKEKFSVGLIVYTVMGLFLAWIVVAATIDSHSEIQRVKALVDDWNVVYEEGWEVVDQDGKIVTLERRLENK